MKIEEIELKDGKYYPKSLDELKFLVNYDNYSIKLSSIDISNPNITSLVYLFCNTKRTDFSGIGEWDTSNITALRQCFYGATYFNENINNWNTSKCRTFVECFARCVSFNQPLDKWDVSNAKSLYCMFYRCLEFNQDISSWNVSNVTSFQGLFRNAKSFNQDISKWNVSGGENFEEMLAGAENFNQDISKWDMRNARTIERILYKAKSFSYDISKWDISSVCNTDDALKQAGEGTTSEKKQSSIKRTKTFNIRKINTKATKELDLEFVKLQDEFSNISWFTNGVNDRFYVSVNKNKDSYNYIVCRLFDDIYYLIDDLDNEIDGDKLDSDIFTFSKNSQDFTVKLIDEKTKVTEPWMIKEADSSNSLKSQNIELLFDTKGILIKNLGFYNINTIYAIMFEYVLACAYKNKIFVLNNQAREGYKHQENKLTKNKKALKKTYADICMFDLHHYYNMPIEQHKCSEFLIKTYRIISDFYFVKEIHDDLKETISQVAFLVSDDSKTKTGLLFSSLALTISLIGLSISIIKFLA